MRGLDRLDLYKIGRQYCIVGNEIESLLSDNMD